MEDAMIINKSSYERGFAHASVFYSLPIDLRIEQVVRCFSASHMFGLVLVHHLCRLVLTSVFVVARIFCPFAL